MRKAKSIVSWSVIPISLFLVLGLVLAGCGNSTDIADSIAEIGGCGGQASRPCTRKWT